MNDNYTYKWLDSQEVRSPSSSERKAAGFEAAFQKSMVAKMFEILNQL